MMIMEVDIIILFDAENEGFYKLSESADENLKQEHERGC